MLVEVIIEDLGSMLAKVASFSTKKTENNHEKYNLTNFTEHLEIWIATSSQLRTFLALFSVQFGTIFSSPFELSVQFRSF